MDKPEGKIVPQGPSVLVAPKKEKHLDKNPYEQLINGRLHPQSNGYATVGFEAREMFDQANFLS
jgi:hypothetical protein